MAKKVANTAVTTETTPAVAATKKVATKKVAPVAQATAKKAPAKKIPPKKEPARNAEGLTIRGQVFAMLAKAADGMTGAAIMEKLGKPGEPAYTFLKDEGCSDTPRIKREVQEGVRGAVYKLTAAGKKAVEKGTVDSEAAPMSTGKKWPE